MAESSGRDGSGGLKVLGLVMGIILFCASATLNAYQAAMLSQFRDTQVQVRDQEVRLRTVEQAVGEMKYIRQRVDEAIDLLREHMRREQP